MHFLLTKKLIVEQNDEVDAIINIDMVHSITEVIHKDRRVIKLNLLNNESRSLIIDMSLQEFIDTLPKETLIGTFKDKK